MIKKIYLFRHGETDWNKDNRIQGRTDNPLNLKGLEQAKTTAKILRNKGIEHIYCSPLIRAIQTANALKDIKNIDIEIIDDLIEGDFGIIEGAYIDLVEEQIKNGFYKKVRDGEDDCESMGGESNRSMGKRLYQTLLYICRNTPYKTIAISTHGHILKNLLLECNFNDTSKILNCEVIEAEYNDGKLSIVGRIKND